MNTETIGYNRDTLLEMLKCRVVEDGTLRVLRGTLQDEYLPEKFRKEGITPDDLVEDLPDNIVTVWDVEENDWRSIRTDRIIEVL